MPTTIDPSFIDSLPPNVAVQFLERVAKSPARGLPLPRGRGLGVDHLEAGRREGDPHRGGARGARDRAAAARRDRLQHPRYEWIHADLAHHVRGCGDDDRLPLDHERGTAYILSDSECQIVFAEDDTQIAKLTEQQVRAAGRREGRHLRRAPPTATGSSASRTWRSSARTCSTRTARSVEERIDGTDGDSLATLIYTSGTTGRPKGVRLRHKSWTYEGVAIQAQEILSEDDLQYRWLPMAHSFGKVLLSTQLAIGFATAVDGRVDKIIENLAVVKPTFMGAAPRIFEKAHGRIVTMQAQEGGLKEKIFNAAFAVGQRSTSSRRGQVGPAAR